MKKNGFVTSALLYGILSLFLVLVLGTVAIIGNRKIANDKIKQSALDDVQDLTTDESCFVIDGYTITGYNDSQECTKTVFIPEKINSVEVNKIGSKAFADKDLINVTIKSNITSIDSDAFEGNKNMLFIFKNPQIEINDNELWGATDSYIRVD